MNKDELEEQNLLRNCSRLFGLIDDEDIKFSDDVDPKQRKE